MSNHTAQNSLEAKKLKVIIPKRVTIETIFGCNANCVMCVVNHPTERKKNIMPVDMFYNIIDSLLPYKEHLDMMDLYCLGEPLLDPHIFDRIHYVKSKGFRNLAISTNADLLKVDKQRLLLDSGIDTVLFSIDGVKKETHESTRRGVIFERVIENCLSIIRMRNEGNYKTRFVIRFIRQDNNIDEWEPYKKFWMSKISRDKKDFITLYDVHTWGGEIPLYCNYRKNNYRDPIIEKQPCKDVFEILYILANGSVPLCNEDWLHPKYNFGNVTENSPIEIFNSRRFNKVREIHLAGNKNTMDMCRKCTVRYSLSTKEIV